MAAGSMRGPDRQGEKEFRFADRMTDIEALFWRLEEVDASFCSNMTLVLALDGPVDLRAARERMDLVSRRVPRLRDRVVNGPLDFAPPGWEPDPDFDLDYHVRQVRSPGEGTAEDLLSSAEMISSEKLDRRRPPWQMVLVDGLHGGRQGVALRLHHSYTDGMGAVRLAMELFDLDRRAGAVSGRGDRPMLPPSPRPPLLGRMVQDLAGEAKRAVELIGRVGPWAASGVVEAIRQPHENANESLDLLRSLRTQLKQAGGAGSPVMTRRSAGTRLASIDLPLEDLRRAAHGVGSTINDAYVAAALGGLALYHAKHSSRPTSLRIGMPISTRAGGTEEMHNQVGGVLLRAPLGLADPQERIRLVSEMISQARGEPVLGLLEDAAAIGLRLPGARQLIARLAQAVDVVASNLPGPPLDLFLCGSKVESMVPVGPRSGAALNLTLLSYHDVVHVGINMDPAAVPDPPIMVDCLRAGFEEMIAL